MSDNCQCKDVSSYYHKMNQKSCLDYLCKFNYTERTYSQICTNCKSGMFKNSTRQCKVIKKTDSDYNPDALYKKYKKPELFNEQIKQEITQDKNFNRDRVNGFDNISLDSVKINDKEDINNNLTNIEDNTAEKYFKYYREAQCMNCNQNFTMNYKINHYIFWGLFSYCEINDYTENF